ncbi:hypothetical protein CL634_02115 [bacterium]|nr:hypothetical protein [bacterium]|tara:strand:- start:732 stop:956 length:225 start_codon:yes stop_codon:yes gene_type:complete
MAIQFTPVQIELRLEKEEEDVPGADSLYINDEFVSSVGEIGLTEVQRTKVLTLLYTAHDSGRQSHADDLKAFIS